MSRARRTSLNWTDAERWEWYAAGDKSIAPPAVRSPAHNNSAERVFWEMGWVVAVPLAFAALTCVLLAV